MRTPQPGHLLSRLTLLLLLPVGIAAAQQPAPAPTPTNPPATTPTLTPPAPPPPFVYPAAAADTVEVLVTARTVDSVRAERDRLLGERRDAEARWNAFREQAARLKASYGELRAAVDVADGREKAARKEKRDGDRVAAQVDKRRMERARDIVDARYGLRQAQAEYTRIERDYIDASIRAADAELAIAERRDSLGPAAADANQRQAFQELTNRWLQALRTRAARSYDLEDRRFKVVEAQLDVLKKQRE